MTELSVTPLRSAPAMLRRLSGFERLFLALDKINGFNFGITVGFSGVVAEGRWRAAFEQVKRRHPLLRAGINEEDPHAPYSRAGRMFRYRCYFDGAFHRVTGSGLWRKMSPSRSTCRPDRYCVLPFLKMRTAASL